MRSRAIPRTVSLLAPILLFCLAAPGAGAQTADPVLAGLEGVELQNDAGARLGLTPARAYEVVEEELRQAGVRFLPPPDHRMQVGRRIQRMPKGYALLFFQVATVASERVGGYAVDLSYQLLDRVRLSRDGTKETVASVYRGRQLVLMTGTGSAEEAERRLRAMAKEFAADFKASNPEKAGSRRAK